MGPGYILLGTELYWRDQICRALQKAIGLEGGNFGLAEFDLRHDSLDRVLEQAETQSMFAPRQLLFVKNAQTLLSRRTRDTEPMGEVAGTGREGRPTRSDNFAAYFRNPNPSSTLVFEMTDVNLESDDWREKEKASSRVEAFERICDVVLMRSPSFEEAVELIQSAADQHGQKISLPAAQQLVAAFHRNMAAIQMELEKLCLYDPAKGRIDLDDVNRMITGSAGESSWGLTDAIGARNATAALQILDVLRRGGKYAPLTVSEVARYLRQLILLKESRIQDPRQAARILWDAKLGVPQGLLPALLRQARNFTGSELLRGIDLAFKADLSLRSGPPNEALVLERLVLDLIRPAHPAAGR